MTIWELILVASMPVLIIGSIWLLWSWWNEHQVRRIEREVDDLAESIRDLLGR